VLAIVDNVDLEIRQGVGVKLSIGCSTEADDIEIRRYTEMWVEADAIVAQVSVAVAAVAAAAAAAAVAAVALLLLLLLLLLS
jgi:hypothetical protein